MANTIDAGLLKSFNIRILKHVLNNINAKEPKKPNELSKVILEDLLGKKVDANNKDAQKLLRECSKLTSMLSEAIKKKGLQEQDANQVYDKIAVYEPSKNPFILFYKTILSYLTNNAKSREGQLSHFFSLFDGNGLEFKRMARLEKLDEERASIDAVELAVKKKDRIVTDEELKARKEPLDRVLEDKKIAQKSEFKIAGMKGAGVASGYRASRSKDGHMFMIKNFHLNASFNWEKQQDNMCFVNEYVMGGFYKRWLYNATPHVELVVNKDASTTEFQLRSKFLHDFKTVSEFTRTYRENEIGGKNLNRLKNAEGGEKLFAAILVGGEIDRHAGNTGVMKIDGKDVLCKIDHGQSAMNVYSDSKIMWRNFCYFMNGLQYSKHLTLDVSKFKESILEMCKTSDDEIENFVNARIENLSKNGFNFKMDFSVYKDNSRHKDSLTIKHLNSKAEFKEHYIQLLKQQRDTALEFCKMMEVIEKMDKSHDWKKGKWIQDINGKDPLEWAKQNKVTIEGKSAQEWEKSRDKKHAEQVKNKQSSANVPLK